MLMLFLGKYMKTNRVIVLSALLVGLGSCASEASSSDGYKNLVPQSSINAAQIGMIAGALQPMLGTEGAGLVAFGWYAATQVIPQMYPWATDKTVFAGTMQNVFVVSSFFGAGFSAKNFYNYLKGKKVEKDNAINMKKALIAMQQMNKQLAVQTDKTNAQIAEFRAELKNNAQSSAQSMQAMMQEHTEASDSKLASLASKLGELQKALNPNVAPILPIANEHDNTPDVVIPAVLVGEQDQPHAEVAPQYESKSEEVSSGSGENDSQS